MSLFFFIFNRECEDDWLADERLSQIPFFSLAVSLHPFFVKTLYKSICYKHFLTLNSYISVNSFGYRLLITILIDETADHFLSITCDVI